jgi:hypothetical protein
MLKRLVDGSSSKAGLKGVVADGAYDSKSNFRMLADRGIDPLIRVRKNSSLKGGGCMPRKFAVVEQLGNADWRRKRVMVIGGWWSQRSQALNVCSESTSAQ